MRDHRKISAFQLADELVIKVYSATRSFPPNERFGLVSQIRRSAVSIPTNIVEGCARPSEAEYVRFSTIAFASARELGYLVDLSRRLGFLGDDAARKITGLQGRTAAALAGLIRAFQMKRRT